MLKNKFSSNLKHLLNDKGMSQDAFAKLIGKKRSTIGSYIRSESEPSIDILIKITDIFGISLNDLVFENLSNYREADNKVKKVAEDSATYETKFELLKSLFGGDTNILEKKMNVLLKNQIKILDRLDRTIIKDVLKQERERIEIEEKQSQ